MKAETKKSLHVTRFVALTAPVALGGAFLADFLFAGYCSNTPCGAGFPGMARRFEVFTILYLGALTISLLLAGVTRGIPAVAVIHEVLAALAGTYAIVLIVVYGLLADPATIALREAQTDVGHGHHAFMCATGLATALVLTIPLILRVMSRLKGRIDTDATTH